MACIPPFVLFPVLFYCPVLYLVIFAEIIIKVIIEIIFKIFQIIRCKETVYCIRDCCYRCNCPDNGQYPDHCIFLFVSLILMKNLTQF